MTLNRKMLTGSMLAILAVLFVALVLLNNIIFRGVSADLTENSLYTLSQGTRNILGKLDEPIHLTLYFSDKATADSNRSDVRGLRLYFDRLRELLEEMSSIAGSKIQLQVIDPLPYSEAEDSAVAAGIQGIPLGNSGERIFLGLAGSNSTDGHGSIAFFDPSKEEFLEYDVAKLIYDLNTVKKPTVGLLTGLPMTADYDPQTQQMHQPWAVYQQLTQLFKIQQLDAANLQSIDANMKLLVVVHPKQLSENAQYAIDQFVLRGGHLLVLVDPNAELDMNGADPSNPMAAMMAPKSSDLPVLFKAWGVQYSPNEVVLDREHALTLNLSPGAPPVRHPVFLRFDQNDLPRDDIITANLDSINVASAGFFKLDKDSKADLMPLLQTGDQAMTVPLERIKLLADPSTLLSEFKPTAERYIIAGRLQGKFKTAFPQRKDAGHLLEAKERGEILLIADTDILTDRLWVQIQDFFGQKLLNTFASNGDFFINAVDNLSGSSDLISIRGRGTSHRPFIKVEELKLAADNSFRIKERELQQELNDTEQKLSTLQSNKSNDQKFVLSPEQQQELENFLKRKLEIRKELRDVRHQLDADIDSLGAWLKFINIALMPILVTLGTLGLLGWKAKHKAV